MAKVKDAQEALITRNQYNSLKKMDRSDSETFLKIIYDKGYAKGCRDTETKHKSEVDQAIMASKTAQRKSFKDELIALLAAISGIGPATTQKIKDVLEKWCI